MAISSYVRATKCQLTIWIFWSQRSGISFVLVSAAALTAILFRSSTISILVTLLAYVASVVSVTVVLPHLISPITIKQTYGQYESPLYAPRTAPLIISITPIGASGKVLNNAEVSRIYSQCFGSVMQNNNPLSKNCIKDHGIDCYLYELQPASRLPLLQLLMFAVLVTITGLTSAITHWLLVRIEL